jgi:rfaE bifunctional protein nucleotidyltransferase chain/domain
MPESLGLVRPAKVTTLNALVPLREQLQREGRVVVWANGCFDLIHIGHIRNLQAARALGDVLIVGINTDDSVRRLKGPERPIVSVAERAELLAALECVDYVLIFEELRPDTVLAQLKPDVHCKGGDYAPPHGKPVLEAALIESYGGRIVYLPLVEGRSTTEIVRRIRETATGDQPEQG